MDYTVVLTISLGLLAGGFIKGITGMGMPLVSIPVIAGVLGLPQAIGLLTVSYIVSNLWQVVANLRDARDIRPLLLPFLFSGGVGVVAGSFFLTSLPVQWMSMILGALLLAYALAAATRRTMTSVVTTAPGTSTAMGFLSGLLHGATGISSPVGGAYFHAVAIDRPNYIFAVSAMLLFFSTAQAAVLMADGTLSVALLVWGAAAVPPVIIAMQIGNYLASRVSHRLFERGVLVFVALMGIRLLYMGFRDL